MSGFFIIFEDMKRRIIAIAAAAIIAMVPAAAQNNNYQIDDECYALYREVERLTGQDGFEAANEAFLKMALEKNDPKAQTLYYVSRLKNCTAKLKKVQKPTPEQEKEVMTKMEDLKQVAQALDYPQYYYYAYDLAQTYLFNHGKTVQAMDMVQEMRKVAVERNEPYGIWMGNRYIISLYISQNDYISAKKYIKEAIRIYETSSDPIIRRQSGTRLYCELADTYPIGHDSVKINLRKALASSKQQMDTLRLNYHKAKLCAYEKRVKEYEEARDYCLADPQLYTISPSAEHLFKDIDMIVYGLPGTDSLRFDGNNLRIREVKYLANIAEHYGQEDLAFQIEKVLVARNERSIASANTSRLTELNARLGNDVLTRQVSVETLRAQKAMRVVMLLTIILLLGVLIFTIIYLSHVKKTNEKLRLADAAKTRFVQNMSHEVRTPLNAIVGFSQLLSLPDGSFPEEEKQEFAEHIVNNTKMLTMLLDDILNASAMDKGEYRISYEEGEVHFMAQAAISSAEHRLQPGVKLYYQPENQAPFPFTTDPRRVQQILINLITNACKHTSEGEIKVSSSLTDCPGYVSYAVTDTGPGVPADQAEKIFDRFTKLNEYVQGTGLGLSICRDIAGRMGAKVYLDTSYQGKGARFVFEVPVKPLNKK